MEKMSDEWIEIVPDVVKVPYNVYKYRHTLWNWMTSLQAMVNVGATDIVVLGVPASGKSVLTSFLYGEVNNLTYNLPEASKKVETKAISLDKWAYLFRVIPGQTSAVRFEGLSTTMTSNPVLQGVVYVVNYGYTEDRDRVFRSIQIQERKIVDIDGLRKRNLEIELRDFTTLVDKLIEGCTLHGRPKWLCIVCSKVDLFYDEMEAAQRYYDVNGTSPFSKQLARLQNSIGKVNFKIASAPVSSYMEEFEWNGIVIKPQITRTETRTALLKNLVQTLANLSGDE